MTRARRVAHAYRALALTAAPAEVEKLDARLTTWGEKWVAPRPVTFGPDDWLPAGEAGDILAISAAAINRLRRTGRLEGRWNNRRWEYRARDVSQLSATPRRRHRRATDTLNDDGRSAP